MKNLSKWMLATVVATASGAFVPAMAADAADADAAQALIKKSDCGKCHAVDKKKDGPSFKETAGKYKDKPNAEADLYKHLTTGPTIKIDGKEEKHESPKIKDDAEIKNLIKYVLSR